VFISCNEKVLSSSPNFPDQRLEQLNSSTIDIVAFKKHLPRGTLSGCDGQPGFPRCVESIELWNRFSRPWKSIEFGQNVQKVLKKYGNS